MVATISPKLDPSGFYRFEAILAEAKARGHGFAVAQGVYARRTGEPCPFTAAPMRHVEHSVSPVVRSAPPAALAVLDFETRSECDLKAHGAWVYAEHPSTTILCLGWRIGEAVGLWTPEDGDLPAPLLEHIRLGGLVWAHNVEFEQAIWQHVGQRLYGFPAVPAEQWRDTMALAAAFALPLRLDGATAALGAAITKDPIGHAAMMRLSRPRKPTKGNPDRWHDKPADYAALYAYCRQDVAAEAGLHALIPDLSPAELQVWLAHNRINRRGLAADRAGIMAALRMIDLSTADSHARVAAATGGGLTGEDLNSWQKVLPWCLARGVALPDYTKASIAIALAGDLPEDVRVVLDARRSLGRASTKKYLAMLDRMSGDDRIRGSTVYHGASTGRWTGRGIQPQNLPRAEVADVDACLRDMGTLDLDWFRDLWGDPLAAASGCLRGCLWAAPGKQLVGADYSAIEARVVNWLAGQRDILDVFRAYDAGTGPDVYRVMASYIVGGTPAAVDKLQRQLGKKCELGCGFGMGPNTFQESCEADGLMLSATEAIAAVRIYRETHPQVVAYWTSLDAAAISAVRNPGSTTRVGASAFRQVGGHLRCRLPSGRKLVYPFAEIRPRLTPWGEMRDAMTFMAVNPKTKQWTREDSYGGKLAENITQAVARDLMAAAILRAEAQGFPVVLTVHDEILAEIDERRADPVRAFEALLCDSPAWADGLPVAAEGWAGRRYRK